MCGIIAVAKLDQSGRNCITKIVDMASMMNHRGPDDSGYAVFRLDNQNYSVFGSEDTALSTFGSRYAFQPTRKHGDMDLGSFEVGLGHKRLSIIDLSECGHQPLCDESERFWVAFNGEIYNHISIREELVNEGYSFVGHSDTEVVLKAYMHWGEACQTRFNGMWAISIWDNAKKRLWLSRDRFGVKPLYYTFIENWAIVCSEIKCILPVEALRLNRDEAKCCILDGPSESHRETMYEGIYRFPAGYSGFWDLKSGKRDITLVQYYEYMNTLEFGSFSERRCKEYAGEFRHLLSDAVKLRLQADVPVSCALSGGLDSTAITYLASQHRAHSNSSDQITTVSNIYQQDEAVYCDESKFIDIAAQEINVCSLRKEPSLATLPQDINKGIWAFESCPAGFPISSMSTFSICKENGIKVNLDGQGADELLAGYTRFWANYFRQAPLMQTTTFLNLLKAPGRLRSKLKAMLSRISRHEENDSCSFFAGKFASMPEEEYRQSRTFCRSGDLSQALNGSYHYGIKLLLRTVDAWSMINSVESRQPFMDYRLYEFMQGMPLNYRMHLGWSKYVMRIAFCDYLPQEIVWRKDKMGWPQPIRYWMQRSLPPEKLAGFRNTPFLRELLPGLSPDDYESLYSSVDKNHGFMRLYMLNKTNEIFVESGLSGLS